MRSLNKQSNNPSKIIIIVAAILLAVGIGAYAVYASTRPQETKRDANGVSTEMTPEDKALEENLNNNPDDKEKTTQTDTPQTPTVDETTNLQKVNVILTNVGETSGTVSASGFVSNTVESNGTCTYVFTNGNATVKKTTTTLTNPNSTTCSSAKFPSSELSSGTWKVQLQYSSSASTGTSNELELKVE